MIVTENDGHTLTFDQEIRVLVEPRIDTPRTYNTVTNGDEDTAIIIDWHPEAWIILMMMSISSLLSVVFQLMLPVVETVM
ncbi:hypothetical protein OK016_01145 [Vibrio chagasii]|nr:hypothetical protein [Vibrio chagasii]